MGLAQLQSEQGNLSEYTDRQSAANIAKTKLEGGLVDAGNKLTDMEASRQQATLDKKALEGDNLVIKKDIEDLEISIQKLEQEKAMNKMETRIRELESEVDAEQRRMGDSIKNLSKSERRIKEMSYAADEDMKNQTRMQGLVDGLQDKIKSYKKQIEEAEDSSSPILTKCRGTQALVGDSGELADLNEKALAKAKAKARGASVAL